LRFIDLDVLIELAADSWSHLTELLGVLLLELAIQIVGILLVD